jgi:segregation and condensation protein B
MNNKISRSEKRLCNIEAALYSAGRPLNIKDLKKIANTKSNKVINKLVIHLTKRYMKKNGALEVKQIDKERVSLQLKPEYDEMVKRFNNKPLLTLGPLKTLSYIAFHQPVKQGQVVEARGSHVYGQLKTMENMGLIYRERSNDRRYIIKTTPFFSDYFGFSQNETYIKLQLKQIFEQLKITKLENGGLEIEDLEKKETKEMKKVPNNRTSQDLPQYPSSNRIHSP